MKRGLNRLLTRQVIRLVASLITGLFTSLVGVSAMAAPNDPFFSSAGSWGQAEDDQWALRSLRVHTDMVDSSNTTDSSAGGGRDSAMSADRVVVAVIDTGLDYTHEDFAASQIWRNARELRNGQDDDGNGYRDDLIGWNFVDNSNNPWDQSGHGTHIAGIIAACTDNGLGIAAVHPQALIMPLKVANFAGQARSAAVAAAIYYAVDHGARVINLSLGGELVTELERDAARYAAQRDVVMVVSAGNTGLNAAYTGYASLPGVLVAGASDLSGERAGFSSFGSAVDVLAPGVDVLSLRARDTDFIALSEPPDYVQGGAFVGAESAYYRASGTSFSAALVSGMASRLIAARPELSGVEVRRTLQQSAVDVGVAGVDQLSGYGRVDFTRALSRVLSADAEAFVEARLAGVELELRDQQVWLHVQGSAAAGQLDKAELLVRAAPGAVATDAEVDGATKRTRGRDEGRRREDRRNRSKQPPQVDPTQWQPLAASVAVPTTDGTLGSIGLEQLIAMTGGATAWELRLLVQDRAGNARESRLAMALPVPDSGAAGGEDGE
ncbi:MAG: S8 family serine peptidase [Pseudomonadales bacterium]|nr:S8 family serine peptidase [Pseudomonadales bacterium]